MVEVRRECVNSLWLMRRRKVSLTEFIIGVAPIGCFYNCGRHTMYCEECMRRECD